MWCGEEMSLLRRLCGYDSKHRHEWGEQYLFTERCQTCGAFRQLHMGKDEWFPFVPGVGRTEPKFVENEEQRIIREAIEKPRKVKRCQKRRY